MVTKKIISILLAVLMLASACTVVISAAEAETTFEPEYNTNLSEPTINYKQGRVDFSDTSDVAVSQVIKTAEDKIATMDCRLEKDGYRLYVDAYSGEVGVENIATGEILLTNPYDLSESNAPWSTKTALLSQLVVNFKDITAGQTITYYSADWTIGKAYSDKGVALDDEKIEPSQIRVKNIKNGLRVEYTIGREQTKMLVPRVIEKSAFETKILAPMEEAREIAKEQWKIQYMADDPKMTEKAAEKKAEENAKVVFGPILNHYKLYGPGKESPGFPITKKMEVYILNPELVTKELARIEQIIKTYIPDYTYEDLDSDHLLTEYVDKDKNPPLFKMALEYTLDEQGLSVRLPANGIRFTESLYELLSVEILPYMGASSNAKEGYTFFPDGSGALFDYQQIASAKSDVSVVGKVYGQDYAYHTISGAHQEPIRYPVFGMTSADKSEDGTAVDTYTDGFVAIVEEGDSMMELVAEHEVTTSGYNTVKMRVYPRPQDTYNVADAISVGQNDTWTVVSSRKYTGNYKIRYIMLTPEEEAAEKGLKNTYDTTYVGMAMAYRNYLESTGVLTRLTADQVNANNIQLYIETFGSMQTTERFLSIPVEVMTPLTTFADISTMYDDLSAEGIDNVNFILTGYTKGGLTSPQVPYYLKWDKAVKEGGMDFSELTEVAKEKGFGIFPDFDFAFVKQDKSFDGLRLKKHAVKTIDDRYTSKREYSATKQTYISYFELALSPAYFNHFYTKLTENFLKYDPIGISVASLGTYLNSDFDEDEPYNRADAQNFTVQAFAYLRENYSKVMTAGGNAYSWKYVDYITDIALDSSRYSAASASVPFLGIVLHGYVEFAGTPINMEGNIDYAVLKALESGAGLKFILSYRNTDNLKNDEQLSKYYSIRYNIWKDDLVSLYSEVNGLLKNVQTSTIVDHYFLNGLRVPDNDELEADAEALLKDLIAKEQADNEKAEQDKNYRLMLTRKLLTGGEILKDVTQTGAEDNKTTADLIYDLMVELADAKNADVTIESAKSQAQALREKMNLLVARIRTYVENCTMAEESIEALLATGIYDEAYEAEMRATLAAAKNATVTLADGTTLKISDAEAALTAAFDAVVATYNEGTGSTIENYTYVVKAEGETEDDTVVVNTTNKYESDANRIVYVKYENGTAFVLNFNNYAVLVEAPNGITYTVAAYGYVHIKPAANS